jgi:hypothetical protein
MNNCSAAPFLFLLYISQPPLTKSDSQPASQPATPTPTRPTSSTTINNMHSQTTDMNMKYPPMRTRCGRYDDSPGKSILLKHKDEGFVPSWRLPAHDAPVREVREFLVDILLEREVPLDTARAIASQWRGGGGLQLQIVNYAHYQCYFKDKNAQVIYRDVHAIIRRESKFRQRQRDARRQRANLAKCDFYRLIRDEARQRN